MRTPYIDVVVKSEGGPSFSPQACVKHFKMRDVHAREPDML
jgi:hypothetical protein